MLLVSPDDLPAFAREHANAFADAGVKCLNFLGSQFASAPEATNYEDEARAEAFLKLGSDPRNLPPLDPITMASGNYESASNIRQLAGTLPQLANGDAAPYHKLAIYQKMHNVWKEVQAPVAVKLQKRALEYIYTYTSILSRKFESKDCTK